MKQLPLARLLKILVLCFLTVNVVHASLVPDINTHRAFLWGEWQPNRPNVAMFADPFCPYCIKALKNPDQYRGVNIFLFWSPVLGPRSRERAATYFTCETPSADAVIKAAIDRLPPFCSGQLDDALVLQNQQMVDAYNPQSVPAYFLAGAPWSPDMQINMQKPVEQLITEVKASTNIKIVWSRYQPFAVGEPQKKRPNLAVFLPPHREDGASLRGLMTDQRFNWYLFHHTANEIVTEALYEEFALLNGLDEASEPVVLLEGKPLTLAQLKKLSLTRLVR